MFVLTRNRHGQMKWQSVSENRNLAYRFVQLFVEDCKARGLAVDCERDDEYCRWWIMTDAAGHTVYEVDLVHTLPESAVAS